MIPARFRNKTILFKLLRSIDQQKFKSLHNKERDTGFSNSKYWRLKEQLTIAIQHATHLRLHKRPPMKILDLGTGCGYFPFVCNALGHDAIGLDMEVPMYREICKLLKVERVELTIEPFTKLPSFGRQFDLITALLVRFNLYESGKVWGMQEWEFLLQDLITNHLNPAGSAYFVLVKRPDGVYYDRELLDFFKQAGGKISGKIVYFSSLETFRQ